jgi:hypothetical protein
MEMSMEMDRIYVRSEDVVAREIEDEFLLVPIASGIGDMEDALYTLNETGREIWQRLDGQKSLEDLVAELCEDYEADAEEIRQDVCGLVGELERLSMVEARY